MPNSNAVIQWKNRVISEILGNEELMSCFEKNESEEDKS